MIALSWGSVRPSSSIACLRRMRSSRATSSFAFARVFMTSRMTRASPEIDSRPQTSGCSRMRVRHFASFARPLAVVEHAPSRPRRCRRPSRTARSMITRDQPCDMLPMRRISPLRTYQSVPFTSRTCVTRTLTYSTMPVASPRSTTSPMPTWSSATMKMPFSTSLTMFWAPKPRPAPIAAVSSVSEPRASGASSVDDQHQRDDHDRHVDDVLQDRAEGAGALHEPHGRQRRALERLGVVDVRLGLGAVDDAVHDAPDDEPQDPHERSIAPMMMPATASDVPADCAKNTPRPFQNSASVMSIPPESGVGAGVLAKGIRSSPRS